MEQSNIRVESYEPVSKTRMSLRTKSKVVNYNMSDADTDDDFLSQSEKTFKNSTHKKGKSSKSKKRRKSTKKLKGEKNKQGLMLKCVVNQGNEGEFEPTEEMKIKEEDVQGEEIKEEEAPQTEDTKSKKKEKKGFVQKRTKRAKDMKMRKDIIIVLKKEECGYQLEDILIANQTVLDIEGGMINLENFEKYAFNSKSQNKIKSSGSSKFQNLKTKKVNKGVLRDIQIENQRYIPNEKVCKVKETKAKSNIIEVLPPKLKKRDFKEKAKYNTFGNLRRDKDAQIKEIDQLDEVEIEEGLPYFIQKECIRDKNMKTPEDSDYDCTTLHVPPEYLASLTPAMKQYWLLKADNYDKLLLFKLGKFYELFYEDAIIGNRHLDLNWMGSIKKYHVGFPERALNKYLNIIVNLGYKAAVVEQMETPKMMNKRMKNSNYYAPKVVLREVCNIISKGTFINPFKTSYDARWVLSFCSDFQRNVGVVFFDLSTLKLNIGQFQDDESHNKFRTLCSQLRPIEIIYNKDKQREDLINICSNSPNPPAKSGLPSVLCGNTFSCLTKLEKYFSMDKSKWPKCLIEILIKIAKCELAFTCLSMTISYLQKAMLDDQVIQLASYQLYDPEMIKSSKMILDSQALEHLQILEVQGATKKENTGSLFKILDHTCTKFGKRNFKRWVTTPLCSIDMINDRLDAVEDLMYHKDELNKFRELIKELPDLEKSLSTIYQYSITQNKRAIYFENINLKKLKEFYDLISVLKLLPKLTNPLTNVSSTFMSKRLKQIVSCNSLKIKENEEDREIKPDFESLENENGLFPDITEELKEFEAMIHWTTSETDEQIPEPKPGIDLDFDKANEKISQIKDKFYDYLIEVQKQFEDTSIKYSHAKYRYELEIPENIIKGNKKPINYEFTSSRKGFQRFHTPRIKKLIDELEDAEENVSEALVPFICSIFTHFYSKRDVWDRSVSCLAELDCLSSLAYVSMDQECTMTRPQFIDFEQNKFHSYLELKQMRHPGVESTGVKFIPNDTVVGKRYDINPSERDYIDSVSTLLISGPNMGGKSTLLRQTCIAVIMAQIGCFVPAESCILTPVDRIFTRIGASDSIFEGKSVFFMEMEETKQIVENATSQSLVIMDELGRGTSTFDGFAIAKASLSYILSSIRCMCLFTTHYHMLTQLFEGQDDIRNYHMGYEEDAENCSIKFLYKFTQGRCKQSFGIQVAKLTGLPDDVIKIAKHKSRQLYRKLKRLTHDIQALED